MATLSTLEERASDETQPSATRRIALALASAMNDWPVVDLTSLNDYVLILKREVGDVLSWANVRAKCERFSHASDGAWKAESLCSLLEVWDADDRDLVLDDLLRRVGLNV